MKVNFYDTVEDHLLKFAVIISRYQGKWVFCKHKDRSTYEIPGGHREPGESIAETAQRELQEETGAIQYALTPVCVYSVEGKNRVNQTGEETFGCGSAIAASSMATELIKGKPVSEALQLTNKAVVEALDGLPPHKIHCSVLAEEAIKAAVEDYEGKRG